MSPSPLWKSALAEALGTFTLIFIGAGSIMTADFARSGTGLVGIALAHGLAIGTMVSALGHISGGHFNPAVTGAFVLTGRLPASSGVAYAISQLVGASVAAFFLTAVFPQTVRITTALGTPALGFGVTQGTGIVVEAILTFFLVLVVFGTAVDARGPRAAGGLFIGLTITMDVLLGGPLTGAAMNPARAFGPALFSGAWNNHWVYWIGPLLGGGVAGLLYHTIYRPA
jgi:MIP family channel proteins